MMAIITATASNIKSNISKSRTSQEPLYNKSNNNNSDAVNKQNPHLNMREQKEVEKRNTWTFKLNEYNSTVFLSVKTCFWIDTYITLAQTHIYQALYPVEWLNGSSTDLRTSSFIRATISHQMTLYCQLSILMRL